MDIAALVTPKDPRVAEYIEGTTAWRSDFKALRPVLLGAGLAEDFKWRRPCYTHGGSNVVIFLPLKGLCALPPARLATPLQRRQPFQDPLRPHRAATPRILDCFGTQD
jgi:hypothetical protein